MRLTLLSSLFVLVSCGSEALNEGPGGAAAGEAGAPAASGGNGPGTGGAPVGGAPVGRGGATGGTGTGGTGTGGTGTGGTGTGGVNPGGSPSSPVLDRALGPSSDGPLSVTTLFEPSRRVSATALAFDPAREGELWVAIREFPVDSPCTADVTTGCQALIGRIALIQGATTDDPEVTIKTDGNAWHFMRRPSALAFGDNGNLASCGEYRTGNYDDEAVDYMGPTLWSSDPMIFGVEPLPTQNGTHLDMLHSTPFCMGIAHEQGNAYWLFNGQLGSLDRYDFREPHEIGGEDHSDGELRRYVEGELLRTPETPSHMVLDKATKQLYVVDTGHERVVRLDIDSGVEDGEVPTNDPLEIHARMQATLEVFVPPGTLARPSGIALSGDVLFVTDSDTSEIFAFDLEGTLLRRVEVDLPTGSLSGIAIGPDGRAYLADLGFGAAYRLVPAE